MLHHPGKQGRLQDLSANTLCILHVHLHSITSVRAMMSVFLASFLCQVDFNLPQRFNMEYVDADGVRQRPIMIHRAVLGSLERFFGVLIENYAGEFPLWLAPVQLRLLPVTDNEVRCAFVCDFTRGWYLITAVIESMIHRAVLMVLLKPLLLRLLSSSSHCTSPPPSSIPFVSSPPSLLSSPSHLSASFLSASGGRPLRPWAPCRGRQRGASWQAHSLRGDAEGAGDGRRGGEGGAGRLPQRTYSQGRGTGGPPGGGGRKAH